MSPHAPPASPALSLSAAPSESLAAEASDPWPLRALDRLRALLLRQSVRALGATGRALIRKPGLRVALGGSLTIALALLLTWYAPLLLLAVSPLLLGVPHLLADVRYLVVQPGYHRRLGLLLPVACVLLGAAVGWGMRAGLAAAALSLILAQAPAQHSRWQSLWRRGLGLLVVAGIALVGLRTDWYWLDLAMAHGHNFIAVLFVSLWLLARGPKPGAPPRPPSLTWQLALPLLLFASSSALLAGGVVTARPTALLAFSGQDLLDLDGARWVLAPYLSAELGTRIVLLFAFAQAVHYSVWLRLLPDAARPRDTPRSFQASLRALRHDLGPTLLFVALVVMAGLLLWAIVDIAAARERYFRIAMFHGHLELCALSLWWIEGLPRFSLAPASST